MILVSACLTGEKCRYNGKDCSNLIIKKLKEKGKVVSVCPEVKGGLPVPRLSCEITGGDGQAVLEGQARVVNAIGKDLTQELLAGSYAGLKLAKENKVRLAVLKSKSAACGVGKIFDGSFKEKLIKGNGILTALLMKENIRTISEEEFFGI